MHHPQHLRYTKEHEWVLYENGVAIVGITDYAQEQLGDIVYLELPKVGAVIDKGKSFGVVESVKAVSEIYMPVGGEITKVNDPLRSSPDIINKDPYDAGWLIHVKPRKPEEIDETLLNQQQYEEWIEHGKS